MNCNLHKKAILVVSFGTSYNDTREKTIGAIEKKIADSYPEYTVRRAFTSKIIIDILKKRDGIYIDNVSEALNKLYDEGFEYVVIQPTHVMNGFEYDELMADAKKCQDCFKKMSFGKPLLTSSSDYAEAVEAIVKETGNIGSDTAAVFMGHGTEHYADSAYAALDYRFKAKGYDNFFVGTVEGYPDINEVTYFIKKGGYKKAVLYPFMIVAGDHANNDMAGEDSESWKNVLEKEGCSVDCKITGLGEYSGIQNMFLKHIEKAVCEIETYMN